MGDGLCFICGEPLDLIELMSGSLDEIDAEVVCEHCKDEEEDLEEDEEHGEEPFGEEGEEEEATEEEANAGCDGVAGDKGVDVGLVQGDFAVMHSLVGSKRLNGNACKLDEFNVEKGRWSVTILPSTSGGEIVTILPTNLHKQSLFEVVRRFKCFVTVNPVVFMVVGKTQGTRYPIVKVFKQGCAGLFGMVSTAGIGIVQAFGVAVSVLNSMARSETPASKTAFYARRAKADNGSECRYQVSVFTLHMIVVHIAP